MLNADKNCQPQCRSKQHIFELLTGITRGTSRQLQLLLSSCYNPISNCDKYGRHVIHQLASCGKLDVLIWLLEKFNVNLSVKDYESWWTPLHRAIFYGNIDCAIILLQHGADCMLQDREGLSPLDLIENRGHEIVHPSNPCDAFTWGENASFTLGHESEVAKSIPELVESLSQQKVYIKQVVLTKYHSIFVSVYGTVFTSGVGLNGRLGHGNENTYLKPKVVDSLAHEKCVFASASSYATLYLMESGNIYGFSCDHNLDIGLPRDNIPKLLNWKHLKGKMFDGVLACRYHVVLYCSKWLYTFGHLKTGSQSVVTSPRQVSALNHKDISLNHVASSDAAVAVLTSRGDVYLLHGFCCQKIGTRFHNAEQLAIAGGKLDIDCVKSQHHSNDVVILLRHGQGRICVWRSEVKVWTQIQWRVRRQLHVTSFALGGKSVLFATRDGSAFTATLSKAKTPSDVKPRERKISTDEFVKVGDNDDGFSNDFEIVSVQRVANVHRAVSVAMDAHANNKAVLQVIPNISLVDLPEVGNSTMSENMTHLLEMADISAADIVLQVGPEKFFCHKFILASRTEHFKHVVLDSTTSAASHANEVQIVELEDVEPAVFKQILAFIYTDTCAVLDIGHKMPQIEPKNTVASGEKVSFMDRIIAAAKKLNVHNMVKSGSLADVTLVSSDGVELNAHKPVLIARMDYFYSMLCHGWAETSGKEPLQLPFPAKLLEKILNYLYTDSADLCVTTQDDLNFLCELLVLSDQLLLGRVKDACESALASLITVRNAGELLEFCVTYNAKQLQQSCLQFIVLNLATLLENRLLDNLSVAVAKMLSEYYKKSPVFSRRVITPWSGHASQDDLEQLELEHKDVDVDNLDVVNVTPPKVRGRHKHRVRTKSRESPERKVTEPENAPSTPEPIKESVIEQVEDIKTATAAVQNIKFEETAVELNKSPPGGKLKGLKDIMDEEESMHASPTKQQQLKKVTKKKSQRERKAMKLIVQAPLTPNRPWGEPPSSATANSPPSFRDLVNEEMAQQQQKDATEEVTRSLPWSQAPQSPELSLLSPPHANVSSFASILKEEMSEHQSLMKATKKPLNLIQIEEKAIAELREYYKVTESADVRITVERESRNLETPIWNRRSATSPR